jgi:hypothetical protein
MEHKRNNRKTKRNERNNGGSNGGSNGTKKQWEVKKDTNVKIFVTIEQ